MTDKEKEYILKSVESHNLFNEYLKSDVTPDKYIDLIVEINRKQKKIYHECNEILKNSFYKYKNSLDLIDDEVYKNLNGFATALLTNDEQKDPSLALEIHQLLLKYAYSVNNTDYILESAYYAGLSAFYILPLRNKEAYSKYFGIAFDYMDKYFTLSVNSRYYFNRMYGNYVMMLNGLRHENPRNAFDAAKNAFIFWNREDVRKLDPTFPFDTFILTTKRNITVLLDVFRVNPEVDDDIKYLVYSFAHEFYIAEEKEAIRNNTYIKGLTTYIFEAAKYHVGMQSIDELLETLERLSKPLSETDYSVESKIRTIRLGATYLAYLAIKHNNDKELVLKSAVPMIKYINNYIKNMPPGNFDKTVQYSIDEYIKGVSQLSMADKNFDQLLETYGIRHFPIYVEARVIYEISKIILDEVKLSHKEYLLNNLYFKKISDIDLKLTDDILKFNALSHNIGKISILDQIRNYSRDFNDIDFEVIKEYPGKGFSYLSGNHFEDYFIETSLFHQRWFDRFGGYPEKEQLIISEAVPLITDIIKISLSIEAATDKYFRAYRDYKDLSAVIKEITTDNKKYSDRIASILESETILVKISEIIGTKKDSIIIDAYQKLNVANIKVIYEDIISNYDK